MTVLIGIDLGTTSTCAVALDIERREVVATQVRETARRLPGDPDAYAFDAEQLIHSAMETLRGLSEAVCSEGHSVAGLGVTGQMHGVVLVDGRGRVCSPFVNWQDQRGNRLDDGLGMTCTDAVRARLRVHSPRAGCVPATGHGAVTLYGLGRAGALPVGAKALTIQDLFVLALTGALATDPTDAASWGLYDVEGQTGWFEDVEQALSLPRGTLPPLVATGSCAGKVTHAAGRRAGVPHGLPVAVAMGDNQASFVASVPSIGESLLLNLGTGGQISIPTSSYVVSEG
ncbi:MAG: FGGY family carbohydrate kinase, partial [Myxococcota bacterium]